MKRILLLLLAVSFLATGCATQQVTFNQSRNVQSNEVPEYNQWSHFFVYGLAPPQQSVNVNNHCQDGPRKIQTEQTFLNGLVAGLTWSIYTPFSMTIDC